MEQISSNVLEALNWRYAVKEFSDEQLSEDTIQTLLESINLTPTAYGQQPFRVIHVQSKELREQLIPAAYNQDKVLNSSDLFILAARTDLGSESIAKYMQLAAKTWDVPLENLSQFSDMVNGFYNSLSGQELIDWAKRQAYIALGTLLTTAALEEVDACPMEGFVPDQVDQILGLPGQNLTVACMVTLGKRSAQDATSNNPKVRIPLSEMVIQK